MTDRAIKQRAASSQRTKRIDANGKQQHFVRNVFHAALTMNTRAGMMVSLYNSKGFGEELRLIGFDSCFIHE